MSFILTTTEESKCYWPFYTLGNGGSGRWSHPLSISVLITHNCDSSYDLSGSKAFVLSTPHAEKGRPQIPLSLTSHHPLSPRPDFCPRQKQNMEKADSLCAWSTTCLALSWVLGAHWWMEPKVILKECAHTRDRSFAFPSREKKENLWTTVPHILHSFIQQIHVKTYYVLGMSLGMGIQKEWKL